MKKQRVTAATAVKSKSRSSFLSITKKLTLILGLGSVLLSAHADPRLTAPAGFTITKLPFSVPAARQLALTENGTLIVGSRKSGNVYAIPNALTAASPKVITLFSDLNEPSGLALANGDLYIAAVSKVLRVNDIEDHLKANPEFDVVTDTLPKKAHHGWKYIKFGEDGMLYVPVGAPCNICLSEDKRFATMLRMDPTTGATEIIAEGLRNVVGFAWHPESKDLWVSNNGRDILGDDIPADELNVIPAANTKALHFGYPFVHSNNASKAPGIIKDPKFGDHADAAKYDFKPAAVRIQAHSAPIGMTFYTGAQFPAQYKNALFVAERGSWNRSSKVGYQLTVMTMDAAGKPVYEPFIYGWLEGEEAWGRPNDVLQTKEGHLLVSDDTAGAVYLVRYNNALAAN
ncbi:PQQ-dependent sugar dehydrogenase [Pseudomonadales bacterium]|nr:PQQ-dependent sugar dehydrogenase [Pseudomonadales bacterium]